jgi:hypothetical protein
MGTTEDRFYNLTKDQMATLAPSDLRVIIRKAFDNPCTGTGPGPTMQEVIDHYYDQRNYILFRRMNPTSIPMLEVLDLLFTFNRNATAGSLPWCVPSICEDSDQVHGIGDFDFKAAREQHPEVDKLLTDAGWVS